MMSKKAFVLFTVALTVLSAVAYLVFGHVLASSDSVTFWKDFTKGALIPLVLVIAYLMLFTKPLRDK